MNDHWTYTDRLIRGLPRDGAELLAQQEWSPSGGTPRVSDMQWVGHMHWPLRISGDLLKHPSDDFLILSQSLIPLFYDACTDTWLMAWKHGGWRVWLLVWHYRVYRPSAMTVIRATFRAARRLGLLHTPAGSMPRFRDIRLHRTPSP